MPRTRRLAFTGFSNQKQNSRPRLFARPSVTEATNEDGIEEGCTPVQGHRNRRTLQNAGSSPQSGIAEHLTDTKGRLLHDFLHTCAALPRLARQAEMMSLYKLGKFWINAPQPFVAYPTGSHHIVIGKGAKANYRRQRPHSR